MLAENKVAYGNVPIKVGLSPALDQVSESCLLKSEEPPRTEFALL